MPSVRRKGGARVGAGRRPRPPEEKQANRVVVKLTDDELAALEAAAGEEPLATYARRVLLRHLRRKK